MSYKTPVHTRDITNSAICNTSEQTFYSGMYVTTVFDRENVIARMCEIASQPRGEEGGGSKQTGKAFSGELMTDFHKIYSRYI